MNGHSVPRDLEWLKSQAEAIQTLSRYLPRLQMVNDLIERDCPEAVAWCVAYGRFTELLKQDGKKRPLPRNGIEFLTMTPLSLGKTLDVLSEKVFGPSFM
jgi:hypothetical protein